MSETEAVARVRNRIEAVGDTLGIPDDTIETAELLLTRARTELEFEGRNVDAIAAAALLIACKQGGLPITLGDVARAWQTTPPTEDVSPEFEEKLVSRRMNTLTDVLSVPAPPTQPTDLTDRYARELDMPEEMADVADRLLRDVLDADPAVVAGGTSPSGSAAASLYLAAKLNGLRLEFTQDRIADVAGTTEVTIRTNYQRLAEALGGEEGLRTDPRYRIERGSVSTLDTGGRADTVQTVYTLSAGVVAMATLEARRSEADGVESFVTGAVQSALSDPPTDLVDPPTGRTADLTVTLPTSDVRLLERTVQEGTPGGTKARFVETALRDELGLPVRTVDRTLSLPADVACALDTCAERHDQTLEELLADLLVTEVLE
ncbi:MAG: hypothetical protein ABEJ06_05300 [Haloarculaceae archaeon]